jgi:hypothetical protein
MLKIYKKNIDEMLENVKAKKEKEDTIHLIIEHPSFPELVRYILSSLSFLMRVSPPGEIFSF